MAISNKPTAKEINIELGRPANAPFSIGGSLERQLAGRPTGTIWFSHFIGKSWVDIDYTIKDASASDFHEYTAAASLKFHNGVVNVLDGTGTAQSIVVTRGLSHARYRVITTSGDIVGTTGIIRLMSDSSTFARSAKFNENNSGTWRGDLQILVNGVVKHTVRLVVSAIAGSGGGGEPHDL